ncbi:MAG TPA: hypothetical protein DDW36_01630 [Candidatus Magasanikbacteria bacterium]|nr:hypothetical protein [Candidatus Magasanikbacteria bacterium]
MPRATMIPSKSKVVVNQKKSPKSSKKDVVDVILKQLGADGYYHIEAKGLGTGKVQGAPQAEGQLAVDVAATHDDIIVLATIAGVKPDDIEIAVSSDMLTIRGTRERGIEMQEETFYLSECYWGAFSRTLILPHAVKPEATRAVFKNGVLIVTMPKERQGASIPIIVVEED